MKKMMMIAVMIGALLIPAQGFAQNNNVKRGDRNVRVENRQPDRNNRGGKADNRNDKGGRKNYAYNQGHGGKHRPGHDGYRRPAPKPQPRPHRPQPRHAPAPPCHHHGCGAVETAAVVIGVAGLISLLAD